MNKQELINISFQIIGSAGEAFSYLTKCIEKARDDQFAEIDELLDKAYHYLREAHQFQTELIVKETRGEALEFTILIIHAQDHLMNAVLLRTFVQDFVELYRRERRKENEI